MKIESKCESIGQKKFKSHLTSWGQDTKICSRICLKDTFKNGEMKEKNKIQLKELTSKE